MTTEIRKALNVLRAFLRGAEWFLIGAALYAIGYMIGGNL